MDHEVIFKLLCSGLLTIFVTKICDVTVACWRLRGNLNPILLSRRKSVVSRFVSNPSDIYSLLWGYRYLSSKQVYPRLPTINRVSQNTTKSVQVNYNYTWTTAPLLRNCKVRLVFFHTRIWVIYNDWKLQPCISHVSILSFNPEDATLPQRMKYLV